MFVHENKCSIFFIKTKGQVKMCDQIVKPVNSQKHLGVVVNENLSWTANAKQIDVFPSNASTLTPKKKYFKQNVSH